MRRWDFEARGEAEHDGLAVIGMAVRRERLRAGMSQQQLAWRIGTNQSTISRLENALLPSLRLISLARVVGVLRLGPAFLFPGEPDPPTRALPGSGAPRRTSRNPNVV